MFKKPFITVEGIDGSGKTTLVRSINTFFTNFGERPYVFRSPGGSPFGELIRSAIFSNDNLTALGGSNDVDLSLFIASHLANINYIYQQDQSSFSFILADRFVDSTYAYQVEVGTQEKVIDKICDAFRLSNYTPDLTILLDLPENIAADRRYCRENDDVWFSSWLKALTNIRQNYLRLAKKHSKRFHIIDACRPYNSILEESVELIKKLL